MSVALARRTLIHEWPRFLPAVLAVALSGVLVLVQAALILGIFAGASVYVASSRADLWVGFPGTQSVDLGRPLPADVDLRLRLDPDVARIEPVIWAEGDWRASRTHGGVSVFVTGIDPDASGLMFAHALREPLRTRLLEPGAVIVDAADLDKLGVAVGDRGELNGHRVRVVGAATGLRALGGVNLVASLATARGLAGVDARPSYFVLKLRDPTRSAVVARRLASDARPARYEVWRTSDFAARAIRFWLLDTGAGLGFVFGAGLVLLVGVTIASQSLMGVVAGSAREFATLRALGVGLPGLRRSVLAQSAWIAALGIPLGLVLSFALIALARRGAVPVYLGPWPPIACAGAMLVVALLSGAYATRALRRAEPASLLR